MNSKPSPVEVEVEVEIISKETIKPSLSTPDHLKTHKISILDQLAPADFVTLILFYSPIDDDNIDISYILKKSLSETLTRFYPLAGRMKDHNMMNIDCTDQGIDYFEARANGNMSDFVKPELLNKLLPYELYVGAAGGSDKIQLGVQVNKFDCGGIAIGLCISHKIADGSSIPTFLNAWASTARTGAANDDSPTFDSVHLFPPCEGVPAENDNHSPAKQTKGEKIVTKRFIFDASKIATLQAKFGERGNDSYPSRVLAVSGLIWKCAAMSTKSSKVLFAVNLRGKMDPPLDQRSFGNMFTLVTTAWTTTTSGDESGSTLEELVGKLKLAVSDINGEYVKHIQGEREFMKLQKFLGMAHECDEDDDDDEAEVFIFSSWCRFSVYEVDFGWGKPTWVNSGSQPFKNLVVLMDTRNGDGIEATVNLVEENMARFQQNQELLEFVSSSSD